MSGNSPCDSSHLDEENVDSKGGNKGWWSTKGKSADGMKGHKGKTGQGKGKTGKGKIDTGDAGPTVKGTGKTGDVLETVKGMGKTGVKGSEGKTGDTLETVKGRGKTGDGGVKGLGKTGDVGVKGSKGKTNGKTGDKGKTRDLEHIPSASGGDILLDRNTGGPAAPAAEATEC